MTWWHFWNWKRFNYSWGSTKKFHIARQPVFSHLPQLLLFRNILFNRVVSSCASEVVFCSRVLHVKRGHLVRWWTDLGWGWRVGGVGITFGFQLIALFYLCLLALLFCQATMKNWTTTCCTKMLWCSHNTNICIYSSSILPTSSISNCFLKCLWMQRESRGWYQREKQPLRAVQKKTWEKTRE